MAEATTIAASDAPQAIAASVRSFGEQARGLSRGWFTELVGAYLRWRSSRAGKVRARNGETISETARWLVAQACVKSAFTGASAGAISTGAALLTGETGGAGAFFAVPAGLIALGGEMVIRALLHLDMTCDLAELFGVPFDPTDPEDLWRLYALAFHTAGEKKSDRGLLHAIVDPEDREIGGEIGAKLAQESLLRNVVPVLGVATSAVANWKVTQRVGDTVRRYCRYQRALRDVLEAHPELTRDHAKLLIEGVWFIFTADGHLSPEEAATLARLLRQAHLRRKADVEARLATDAEQWLARLPALPEAARPGYLRVLEIAAAVDKACSPGEKQLLARAAEKLGVPHRTETLGTLIRRFADQGVLDDRP